MLVARSRGWSVLCLALALAAALPAASALAAVSNTSPYSKGSVGSDISYPDCSKAGTGYFTVTGAKFGIVGVTGGKPFTTNTCLGGEFTAAKALNASDVSFYVNLSTPVGTTASYGMTGPYNSSGACSNSDKTCQSYNYGYAAAQNADSYALQQGASSSYWWLDVETANSWAPKTNLNDQVIQGAIDYFQDKYKKTGNPRTVGVYSTPSMWSKIAGSFKPGVPTWGAVNVSTDTAANGYCSNSNFNFGGAGTWLIQYYPSTGGDADHAC